MFEPGTYHFCKDQSLIAYFEKCHVQVTQRDLSVKGYQIHIVEQWVTDRRRPYSALTVFTGDHRHEVIMCVVELTQESIKKSDKKLQELFDSLSRDGALSKKTEGNTVMVTNLSTLPSSLNLVLVTDGNFEAHIQLFYVKLNLRKMGCSGRSALTLTEPTDAQKEQFKQLYRIPDYNHFNDAVLKLVRLVQTALYFFNLLPRNFTDGLLCEATQAALVEAKEKYVKHTSDQTVLEPSLVAALLSTVLTVRNKLIFLGQPAKDVFCDPESFLSAIESFQKSHDKNPTRFLDLRTLEHLNQVYDKERKPDSLKVHKVLRSKIEELPNITGLSHQHVDVETNNLDDFVKSIQLESLNALWKTKSKQLPQFKIEVSWLQEGKELGRNFLRGVSGQKEALKDGVRGFTGSISNLVDKIPKDKESLKYAISGGHEFGDARRNGESSSSLSPISKHRRNRSSSPLEFEMPFEATNTGPDNYANLQESELDGASTETDSSSESDEDDVRVMARSFSTFEFLKQQERLSHCANFEKNVTTLRRCNSFELADLAKIQDEDMLPRRRMAIDIEAYTNYVVLKEREVSLKKLVKRLENIDNIYAERVKELSATCDSWLEREKAREEKANNVLTKYTTVYHAVQQIDGDSSRLNYELVVLEEKLREIEDSMNNFSLKVQALQSDLPRPPASVRYLLWFWQNLQQQWQSFVKHRRIASNGENSSGENSSGENSSEDNNEITASDTSQESDEENDDIGDDVSE